MASRARVARWAAERATYKLANRGDTHFQADKRLYKRQLAELRRDWLAEDLLTRRAKYVGISQLSDDYLDTNGVLMSFEGELENEEDMIAMLTQYGQFEFGAGDQFGTTAKPPVFTEYKMAPDWDTRFHQYERFYNDRARYSLACVLNPEACPVNFADQLSKGHM